ncbi:aminoglycoside phosphotransferase family protein [Chloroflexi bacterium TSY]|nr:aminoglycoside phosphotransferase family protein [Chloroflexi bacterium TSY]
MIQETAKLSTLIQTYFPDRADPPVLRRIPTGKFNTSYWVQMGDEELVLRIAPPSNTLFVFYEKEMMRQESEIHRRLREQTSVPVAEIVVFDDSCTLLDRDYMLMQRLPGRPLTEMSHVSYDSVLRQTGEYLAQVHRLTAQQYGYIGAHRPMEPENSWADAFFVMWNRLIDDVIAVGYYDDEESSILRRWLEQYLYIFDRPIASSLLHMDIWHQNILVDDAGIVTGIVDWDRALWGDPEIEFAVLDYCGISEPAFWEGYGRKRDRSPEAGLRQLFYLLYELQKYIVIYHGRNQDPVGAQRKKEQVWQLVRAQTRDKL